MDLLAFLFAFCLLIVGFMFVLKFGLLPTKRAARRKGQSPPVQQHQQQQHQQLKQAHRFKRQQSRIWWKMDRLHTEFVEKTSLNEKQPMVLSTQIQSQSAPKKDQTDYESLTSQRLSEVFELFLRKN